MRPFWILGVTLVVMVAMATAVGYIAYLKGGLLPILAIFFLAVAIGLLVSHFVIRFVERKK